MSIFTNHTYDGHQLDQVFRPTTSPQPFKQVGPTSPGGVHSTSTGKVNSGHLHLLWDTFWSISTKHTIVGHRLDQVSSTTTYPQPFKLVGSTTSGGVHSTSTSKVNCGQIHLYNIFGLTPPPPSVSQFNQPHMRLHMGQRHGPCATTIHQNLMFFRGTRHQP